MSQSNPHPAAAQAAAPRQRSTDAISGSTQKIATPNSTPPPKGTMRREIEWTDVNSTPAEALKIATTVIKRREEFTANPSIQCDEAGTGRWARGERLCATRRNPDTINVRSYGVYGEPGNYSTILLLGSDCRARHDHGSRSCDSGRGLSAAET